MSEHTKLPWIAATKFSSVVGVPIVAQTGKRICNTANLVTVDDPAEQRIAEANAAFIVRAVNHHDSLVKALRALDAVLDFSDTDFGSRPVSFEDISGVTKAFRGARTLLASIGDEA